MKEQIKQDAISVISTYAAMNMDHKEIHAFGQGAIKMFEWLDENGFI